MQGFKIHRFLIDLTNLVVFQQNYSGTKSSSPLNGGISKFSFLIVIKLMFITLLSMMLNLYLMNENGIKQSLLI